MKKAIKLICVMVGIFIALLLIVSKCQGPTKVDKEKLRELEKRYGDRYSFYFFGTSYLHIRQKTRELNIDDEVEEIYKTFFFEDFEQRERRETYYVYLNVFSSEGGFLYQLFYNPRTDTFVKERKTPHY